MTAPAPVTLTGKVHLRVFVAPTLIGVPVLLVVLASLGGLTESEIPGLPVVPLVTLVSLPVDIWIRDLATAITVGGAIVGGLLAPRPDARIGRITSGAALVWLVALAGQAVLTVSNVLAMPLRSSLDPTVLWSLLTQTTVGRVILIQFALVLLVAILGWVVLDRFTGALIVLAAGTAAFLPGFTGHSGMTDGHTVATLSLGLHVLAAAAWVGGLIATMVYVGNRSPDSDVVLRKFSVLALVCVVLLAESGLLNASLRLDGPASLLTSPYGAIVIAKVCVLVVLIGFGYRQRRRVIDTFTPNQPTPTLIRLGVWETAWMGIVIGLAVALARTAPPSVVLPGDTMSVAAIVLVGLALPLALRFAVGSESAGLFRSYPEAAAVAVVVVMLAVPTTLRSGLLGPQWLAIVSLVILPIAGWMFWAAVDARGRWSGSAIVMLGMPLLAWWTERGVAGGLSWSTWLVVAGAIGMVAWFAATRPSVHTTDTGERVPA